MVECMRDSLHPAHASAGDLTFDIHLDNTQAALHNRLLLDQAHVCCVNLLGSAAAGKTSLLERTAMLLQPDLRVAVMNRDLLFDLDPARMQAQGTPIVADLQHAQGCHLNAALLSLGLDALHHDGGLERFDLLFVEHVGHLICPPRLALGEHLRVLLVAVTEDDDRPLQTPLTFHCADCVLVTQIDRRPYHPFDLGRFMANMHAVNPQIPVMVLSSETGQGMDAWLAWLRTRVATMVF